MAKHQKILIPQLAAVFAALVLSSVTAGLAGLSQKPTQTIGGISSVPFPTVFSNALGFYLGLFFTITFTHFAFIRQPSRYYYITIGLLLFTSLIEIQLFLLAFGFTAAAGILLAHLFNFLTNKK